MLKLFLWLRYLRKKKIVLLSIAAVALSAALLIVVASLFNGFIDAFEQSAVEAMGDIVLAPPIKFAQYPQFIKHLEETSTVKAATAMLVSQGLLHLGKGNVRAVQILGIEPVSRAKVTALKQSLHRQKNLSQEPSFQVVGFPEKVGGFVGIGVVAEPDEKTDEYDFAAIEKVIGRTVLLTTGTKTPSSKGEGDGNKRFKRKTLQFAIADIVFTGIYALDKSFVYLPIEDLQKKLYPNETTLVADQIQIKLADRVKADVAMAQIRDLWKTFAAQQLGWDQCFITETVIITTKQLQSRLVAEFRKQMGVLLVIFGVISGSTVLLIFCIFYMIVETKCKDIAIIKSCGTTNNSVALIFVGFGTCVGAIGSGIGAILGYIVTKNINTIEGWVRIIFGLKLWKSSVYVFSKIPNDVDWGLALPIVLLAVIAAAIGALIPAVIAARVKPVDILRYE